MAKLILPIAGLVIGSAFGAPMLGLAVGEAAAGILFPVRPEGSRLTDLRIQRSSYGTAISRVWGRARLAGNIVWASDIHEHSHGGKGGGPTTYSYNATVAIMVCEGPIHQFRRIWANNVLIYDNRTGTPVWATGYDGLIQQYLGTETQMPDADIEAYLGVNTPAYRGRAYVRLLEFPLSPYGNQMPNFTFEVESEDGGSVPLDQVVAGLLEMVSSPPNDPDSASIQSADMALEAISGIELMGYSATSQTQARGILDNLQRIFHFDLIEEDGKIRAVLRADADTLDIDMQDLGFAMEDADSMLPECSRTQDSDLPKRIDFTYFSPDFNYQTGIQSDVRNSGYAQDIENMGIPITVLDSDARNIVRVVMDETWNSRDKYSVSLPWRYLAASAGDVIRIPGVGGRTVEVRASGLNIGLVGPIGVQGYFYDVDVYDQNATGIVMSVGDQTVLEIAGTVMVLDDVPAVRPQDTVAPGFYAGACSDGSGVWQGAALWADFGGGYQKIATFTSQAVIGSALGVLASTTTLTPAWDNVDTVDIQIITPGEGPVAISEGALGITNPYDNLAVLGDEIIQYSGVTIIGTGQYRLNGIRRGIAGTPTGDHSMGESFMILNGSVIRVNLSVDQIGVAVNYKAVTDGVPIDTVTYQTASLVGRSYVPPGSMITDIDYEPVANGDVGSPDLIFADGDVVMGPADW